MPSFRKLIHQTDKPKEKELNKQDVTALHPEGYLDGPADDSTNSTQSLVAAGNGKKAKRGFLYGLVRRILGGDSGTGSSNSSTLANMNGMLHPQGPPSPPQSPGSSPPLTSGQFKYFPPMPSRMNSSYSTARVPPSPASTASTSNTSRTASQGSSMSGNSEKRKVLRKSSVASRNAPGCASVQGPNITETAATKPEERKALTENEINQLFSGAPQFQLKLPANSEVSSTYSPLVPSVTYPYNGATEVDGKTDHVAFPAHPSFSLCVATPDHSHGLIDTLDPLPSEMPPMSSFQGLEVGSCGWEHFIMNPLADIHNTADDYEEREGQLDLVDEGGRERGMAMDGRELAGVMRSVEVGWVVERLRELGELYWVGKSRGEAVLNDGSSETTAFRTVVTPGTPQTETGSTLSGDSSTTNTGQANPGKVGILSKYTPLELYTNLFTQLLYPPTRIGTNDFHDPFSLKVQIASLTQALGMTRVWLDFSLVEWRIRLGQLLWGGKWSKITDEDHSGNNSERVWLLLQILMACELVVRLDAVANSDYDINGEQGIGGIGGNGQSKEELFKYFRDIRKRKVEWDIVLARRWLENVHLVEREPLAPQPGPIEHQNTSSTLAPQSATPPKKKGWFSGLSAAETPPAKYEPSTSKSNPAYDALIIPQNQETQLSGLLHFARQINWPHVDSLAQALVDDLISFNNNHHTQHGYIPPSGANTPSLDTPRLLSPQKEGTGGALATVAAAMGVTGYFTTSPARPRRLRELSSRSSIKSRSSSLIVRKKSSTAALMRNNTMGSGGWLSRSWFTGLVLPGESMVHLLISALLENDAHVGERIGWEAELYGGFILRTYDTSDVNSSMWWSSFSIVGKVLGDYGGGKECMGWIGVGKGVRILSAYDIEDDEDLADVENVDGWVAIRTKQPTEEEQEREHNLLERVDKPREVFRMSCALGRCWKEGISVVDIDFTVPEIPKVSPQDMSVELEGVIFRRTPTEYNDTDSEAEQTDDSDRDEMTADAGVRSYDVSISFLVTESAETPMLLPPPAIRGSIDHGMATAINSAMKRLVFNLSYEVTFITSFPCSPPMTTLGSSDPCSPPLSPGATPSFYSHPLHKSHLYTVQSLSALATLPAPEPLLPTKSVTGEPLKDSILAARKASILVIDASTAGQAGEVLAKAWCSDRGVGAVLLAREGRSCLACAVREASGLGVAVVIWLAKKA